MRAAYKDYRPNRVISGATRTSLVLRKHGFLNDTSNRDHVFFESFRSRGKSGVRPSRESEQRSAVKIQQMWRMYRRYVELNRDYIEFVNVCATTIQARWRSYHVMRSRLDKAAAVRRFRTISVSATSCKFAKITSPPFGNIWTVFAGYRRKLFLCCSTAFFDNKIS